MLTYQFCIKSRLSITGSFPFSFIRKLEDPVVFDQLFILLLIPWFVEHKMKLTALDVVLRNSINQLLYFRDIAVGVVVKIVNQ